MTDGDEREPQVLWQWGWGIRVSWNGANHRQPGVREEHVGTAAETKALVQRKANAYASGDYPLFFQRLQALLPKSPREHLATGSIVLGDSGTVYVGTDHCGACRGRGEATVTTLKLIHVGLNREGKSRMEMMPVTETIRCSRCNGRGWWTQSYYISALGVRTVPVFWVGTDAPKWVGNFLKSTPCEESSCFLRDCEPAQPQNGSASRSLMFAMSSTLPCGAYRATTQRSSTTILTLGDPARVIDAGALLDPQVMALGRSLSGGTFLEKSAALKTPIVDVLLRAHDAKAEDPLRRRNYLSVEALSGVTSAYEVLVATLKRQYRSQFWRHCAWLFPGTLTLLLFLAALVDVAYPTFAWHGGVLLAWFKEPRVLRALAEPYLNMPNAVVAAVLVVVFLTGLLKVFWRPRLGLWASIGLTVFVIVPALSLYTLGMTPLVTTLAHTEPLDLSQGWVSFHVRDLWTVLPELSLTALLVTFVVGLRVAWGAARRAVTKYGSETLLRRLRLI
ncbi:MAG: hypothetical protein AB7N24_21945 [Dehalococcoidia bacterium]